MFERVNLGVVGSPSVGKSALTVRYLTRRFIGEYSSRKDQTYYNHATIDGKVVKQHIIDCCKDTHGPRLNKLLEWSDGLLVIFSLADLASFYAAAALLRKLAQQGIALPSILVANKADLLHMRCFDYKWGLETATSAGCPYLEVTAAGGWREVELAFTSLTRLAVNSKINNRSLKPILSVFLYWCKRKVRTDKQKYVVSYRTGFQSSP